MKDKEKLMKVIDKKGFTVDELIESLERIKNDTDADGNTEILFGLSDMGCSPTKLYYNDNSIWHGKYVVIE